MAIFAGLTCCNDMTPHENVPFKGGIVSQDVYRSLVGRTIVSSVIDEPTLVIIPVGQSMMLGFAPVTQYIPSDPKVHALDPYSGQVYRARDPLLGSTNGGGGSYITQMMDGTIASFTRKIIFPRIIGSSSVFDWSTSGVMHQLLCNVVKRIQALGWDQNAQATIIFWWDQGHSDIARTTAEYVAEFHRVVAPIDGMGLVRKWFVATTSYANPPGIPSAAISAAQAQIVDNVRFFDGANSDQFTGRVADGVHLNQTSTNSTASLGRSILHNHSW